MKFDSIAELKLYKEKLESKIYRGHIIWVCGGPGCAANGSLKLLEVFNEIILNKINNEKNSFWKSIKASVMPEPENDEKEIKNRADRMHGAM